MFNEYGNYNYPQEILDAQTAYWKVIEPYLDSMSIVEVRALLFYINMEVDVCGYIIRRQAKMRKDGKDKLEEQLKKEAK